MIRKESYIMMFEWESSPAGATWMFAGSRRVIGRKFDVEGHVTRGVTIHPVARKVTVMDKEICIPRDRVHTASPDLLFIVVMTTRGTASQA